MIKKRASGILMHITSLPSAYGIGDMGPWAYKFADFLKSTQQTYWQILPLNPVSQVYGNSPYSSLSAWAGNTLLISPELLRDDGLLGTKDIKPAPDFPQDFCDYPKEAGYKSRLFDIAYNKFKKTRNKDDYIEFCSNNSYWVEDFALFAVIKKQVSENAWSEWPKELRDRVPEHIDGIKKKYADEIEKEKFLQYLFFKQWSDLKKYCAETEIKLIGDIPIYVSSDSVDVWTNPGIFKLDHEKCPTLVAGVPPDYFSKAGQLWGNPVYNWDALRSSGFNWWVKRIKHALNFFDVIRIDHFRGLVAFWEVPYGEKTAVNGSWAKVPVEDFFNTIFHHFPGISIIAEDLGIITADVKEVLKRYDFPGMKILLFAFGEDNPEHPYLPHMFKENCVVYTGTHDNNTARGWFEKEAKAKDIKRMFRYLGRDAKKDEVNWELIRMAMMSVADTAIFPLQDVLGLGEKARMNTPSVTSGNWRWRLAPQVFADFNPKRLSDMTEIYGRANKKPEVPVSKK